MADNPEVADEIETKIREKVAAGIAIGKVEAAGGEE
jgi:hypothetical protein